jgi:hypothetical protein
MSTFFGDFRQFSAIFTNFRRFSPIFGDFHQFSAKVGVFLENQDYDRFFGRKDRSFE